MNSADTPEEIAAQRLLLVWEVLKAMASKVSTPQLTTYLVARALPLRASLLPRGAYKKHIRIASRGMSYSIKPDVICDL